MEEERSEERAIAPCDHPDRVQRRAITCDLLQHTYFQDRITAIRAAPKGTQGICKLTNSREPLI